MREAENRQPGHAGKVNPCRIFIIALRPLDDQHHAGSEHDGKQAAHLSIHEYVGQSPDNDIRRIGAAIDRRTDIGHFRHREADDIHQQYAHHRKTAERVELEIAG